MRVKTGKYISCKHCNKEFYIRPSEYKTKAYCSVKCRAKCLAKSSGAKRRNGIFIDCPICKKSIYVQPSVIAQNKHRIKFCSRKCRGEAMKKGIVTWGFKKTGFKTANNPYPRKRINGIQMTEHRILMQEHLGRKLLKSEHIHHINENPLDNRIENLMIVSPSYHQKIHKS